MWEGEKYPYSVARNQEKCHLQEAVQVMPERPRSPGYSVSDVHKLIESERVKCPRKEGNATGFCLWRGFIGSGAVNWWCLWHRISTFTPEQGQSVSWELPQVFLQAWPGHFLCLPRPSPLPPHPLSQAKSRSARIPPRKWFKGHFWLDWKHLRPEISPGGLFPQR